MKLIFSVTMATFVLTALTVAAKDGSSPHSDKNIKDAEMKKEMNSKNKSSSSDS